MTDYTSQINDIFSACKIKATCLSEVDNKNYLSFDIKLSPGGKITSIEKISNELALHLQQYTKPYLQIKNDEGLISLNFLKKRVEKLQLLSILPEYAEPGLLSCLMGEDIEGNLTWLDLSNNPHMIVSGCTGAGKSNFLHAIIANLLFYHDVSMFLIDPKNIEFSHYKNLKKTNITNNYLSSVKLLDDLIKIMNYRYQNYQKKFEPIVLIIDEFADLILQDQDSSFYIKLNMLAQKCRAANMFIILATQRPSYTIIDGNIKANFPVRLAFKTASKVDSRVILDQTGAENLMGYGDGLIKFIDNSICRFQAAYIDPKNTRELAIEYC